LRTLLIGITISFSLLAFSAEAQAPSFTAASVVNAASTAAGPIAPGMVVDITGSNLGDPTFFRNCTSSVPVPTTCFGISVLVNGTAAPVLYNSASEVTFQAPFNIGGSTATVQVTSNLSGSLLHSAVVTVPVAPTAPGLFSANGTGSGTGYYFDEAGFGVEYSQAVQAGDTVVLFATGFGATNPTVATGTLGPNAVASAVAPVTMTINNQSVPATSAGLEPGNLSGAVVGYDEVIFTVPSSLTVPAGQLSATFPVVVTVGGVASQAVNLIVAAVPLSIAAISPNPVPLSANPQTVTFTGTDFQSGLTLKLDSPTNQQITVPASNITLVSSTQFTAQITVGTTPGTWSALALNTNGDESNVFTFTASGTGPVPTITSIVTTSSNIAQIAQNTWIEVHGTNLSQVSYLTWSGANFSNGLPTTLGGVSATVDGLPAAIYFVSPTQVNILAPLDSATGTVPVQLNTPYGQTAIKTVTELQTSPAFFFIDAPATHVAAVHLSGSLLGPASLSQPGYPFTPAMPGETVELFATGFGQTNPPLTGQLTNVGPFALSLPTMPTVTIGNLPAIVSFAGLVTPGLYQFNVIVPASAPNGDLTLVASYNGSTTQNALITVQAMTATPFLR
jgi:uncharacterized protein (TIGR03437 family)